MTGSGCGVTDLRARETIGGALEWGRARLSRAGVESPRAEARALLGFVLDTDPARLVLMRAEALDARAGDRFASLVHERSATRRPVAYLTGRVEFYSMTFRVGEGAMVPRPETELLVDAVVHELDRQGGAPLVADVGTGCGVVGISIARALRRARVYATEVSPGALRFAVENAVRHGVEDRVRFFEGDLLGPLENEAVLGRLDAVVSNPPYVPSTEVGSLQPEVRDHEPRLALDGGPDGLDVYRRLIPEAARFLRPKGALLALEVSPRVAETVERLASAAGFEGALSSDYAGLQRIFRGRR